MITKEGEILVKLIGKYPIRKSVTDLGARFGGSNSWHLVNRHGFSGVMVDKNKAYCEELMREIPRAHVINNLVTIENCNNFVTDQTGILCIDIDGNDYHIWKAIRAKPDVVVIEAGNDKSIAKKHGKVEKWIPEYVPESPKRLDGASREAMIELASEKGYRLYEKRGVNLIFVSESLQAAT